MTSPADAGNSLVKKGLLYTKTHEWVDPSSSPLLVGISDYAQKSLHDVVYVELPKVGSPAKRGSAMCTLESIKAVAEVYSPLDGVVAAVNEELGNSPELVNKDPYGKGWLVKLDAKVPDQGLLTSEEYAEYVKRLSK